MINKEFKFISTQIGKTATGSVREALMASCQKKSGAPTPALFRQTVKYVQGKWAHRHIIDDLNPITESYFKFCFVRNPWDRCVSQYFFRRQRGYQGAYYGKKWKFKAYRGTTFREFIINKSDKFKVAPTFKSPALNKAYTLNDPFVAQVEWISNESGEVLMDFVGRFESLQEDFNTVCDRVGIPHQKLPHKNRTHHKGYAEYYDDETRQIVAEKYAKDIEHFGYEF